MRRAFIVVGIVLIVAAGLWKVAVAPRFDVRFPDGWSWTLTTVGTNLYPDASGQFPATKQFMTDDDVSISDRTITVNHQNAPAGLVNVDDHYVAKDPNTGAVSWDFVYHASVDPTTGQYVDDKYKGNYYFFPRYVQKDVTYTLRNTSYPGLPVKFQQETTVNGLATYEFAYLGPFDNSASYPDQKLAAGQSIQCTNLELRYWVEPLTGEIVKYIERCNADAVLDTASGKVVSYLSRWSGEVKSDNIIARVNEVSAQRTNSLLMIQYIPLAAGAAGLVLVGLGVLLIARNRAPVTPALQTV